VAAPRFELPIQLLQLFLGEDLCNLRADVIEVTVDPRE
jgi:hypothetical protein